MKTFQTFLQETRELLTEAAYDNKVNSLLNKNPDEKELINNTVKKAKQILGTNVDRMIWFLNYFEQNLNSKINNILTDLEHYGLNIPENKNKSVSKIIFGKKSKEELFLELKKAEELNQSKIDSSKGVVPEENDQIILSFEDGTHWWYVDRAFCEKEGASGDHCGNVFGQNKTKQRILSLRDKNNNVILTFVLEPNSKLSEMKAKGNTKPSKNHHSHILALLSHPKFVIKNKDNKIIKTFKILGFSKATFAQHQNFSIFDLNEDDLNFIHNNNPNFIIDQIKITPTDILNSSQEIKQSYKPFIKKYNNVIEDLLDRPEDIQLWKESIKKDKDLIIYLPKKLWDDFDNFDEILINTLVDSNDLLLQAPDYILKDFNILKEILKQSPNKIKLINPNHKQYLNLIDIVLSVTDGNLDLDKSNLLKLPNLKNKKVKTFSCSSNFITSLEGSPEVEMDFYCSYNSRLTSLDGAPTKINGNFFCNANENLTSLEGAPKEVGKDFYCETNVKLSSLMGSPTKVNGNFHCGSNENLTSLEGAPKEVGKNFYCYYNNNLTNLNYLQNSYIKGVIFYDKKNMINKEETKKIIELAKMEK